MTDHRRDTGNPTQNRAAMPGAFGLPLVGETFALLRDPHGFFVERARAHGPVFKTHLFGSPTAVLSGPDALNFLSQPGLTVRHKAALPHIRTLLGDVLPLIDEPEHARRKALVMEALAGPALSRTLPITQHVLERYIDRWEALRDFTWREEHEAMSFELAHTFLFGRPPDQPHLKRALDDFLQGLTALPIPFPLTTFGRALRARNRLRAHVRSELRAPLGMLATIAAARDGHGQPFGPAIEAEGVHLFFAMYSGLYVALTRFCQSLGEQHERRDRLVEDVRREAPAGPLTAGQVSALPRLQRFTFEVRRVHPLNPMTFMARMKTSATFGGVEIPAGWQVVGALYATHQNPRDFPDPLRFDPDRFDGACPHAARSDAFVAHGAGDASGHRCAGEDLVTKVLTVAGALLLRRHEWTIPAQDLGPNSDFFPMPRSGLRVAFARRVATEPQAATA